MLFCTNLAAQNASISMGARAAGLGNTSASLKDSWAILNNPAGTALLKEVSLNVAFENRPALQGANRMAATLITPTRAGTFAVAVFKFGDDLYSEQLVSAGYSNSFGLASLGARIDYIQYRAEGYDPVMTLGVSLGTIADITDKLSVGCYVSNLNRARLPDGLTTPVKMAAGLELRPTTKVIACVEVEKYAEYVPTWKGGIEITPFKKASFRSGFNVNPNSAFVGIGLTSWNIRFDYALSFSHVIGYAHQANAAITMKRKSKTK